MEKNVDLVSSSSQLEVWSGSKGVGGEGLRSLQSELTLSQKRTWKHSGSQNCSRWRNGIRETSKPVLPESITAKWTVSQRRPCHLERQKCSSPGLLLQTRPVPSNTTSCYRSPLILPSSHSLSFFLSLAPSKMRRLAVKWATKTTRFQGCRAGSFTASGLAATVSSPCSLSFFFLFPIQQYLDKTSIHPVDLKASKKCS